MTPQEVLETLKVGLESDPRLLGYEYFDPIELGLSDYDVVASGGGGADKGSDWYRVFHFPEYNTYIKVSAYYQSYSGADFEDWEDAVQLVIPTERKVIFYE